MLRISSLSWLTIAALCLPTNLFGDENAALDITNDVVYGHKAGMALSYDVIQHPEEHNDAAVVFLVSGGWNSAWTNPKNFVSDAAPNGFRHFRELVDAGYTLYIVRHGSAPHFKVPDAASDVRLAIRHIRKNADDFAIDAARIGVCGGSAGGHLALLLATTGDDGTPDATQSIKHTASRVAAAVAYFPPVDLREHVGPNRDFPALDFDASQAAAVSPILHVSRDDAPVLLIHGTDDKLVAFDNSQRMKRELREHRVPVKLVAMEGAGHGFDEADGLTASRELVAWFDKHLAKETSLAGTPARSKDYPPRMPGSRSEVYKTVGDTALSIHIFQPLTHQENESRPAIVFFFGGGWRGGTPAQFEQHCRYLASRGMIAMTADYRVLSRNQTKGTACVMDAKSAIRWIRKNARRLGLDPDRIVAAGGSAGGHIAACTATIEGFEQPNEDLSISSVPNALALFNPALALANVDREFLVDKEKAANLHERLGVSPIALSPYHQLETGLPPTIVFHGEADSTVPFKTAELFVEAAKRNGDDAVLVGFPGQTHGFFNYGSQENTHYLASIKRLETFLVDRGLLEGPARERVKLIDTPSN